MKAIVRKNLNIIRMIELRKKKYIYIYIRKLNYILVYITMTLESGYCSMIEGIKTCCSCVPMLD
jgi:hypothetical protein